MQTQEKIYCTEELGRKILNHIKPHLVPFNLDGSTFWKPSLDLETENGINGFEHSTERRSFELQIHEPTAPNTLFHVELWQGNDFEMECDVLSNHQVTNFSF